MCPSAYSDNSSDFENKFVCGEIMSHEDLHELGSESAVKAAGKLRQQGRTYESTLPAVLRRYIGLLTIGFQWSTETSPTGRQEHKLLFMLDKQCIACMSRHSRAE